MATNGKSVIPVMATHPGRVLKKELKARCIKQKDFADAIGVPAPNLSELINGKRNITPAIAIKLENVLGISYQNWMNLQNRYYYVKKCHENLDMEGCKSSDVKIQMSGSVAVPTFVDTDAVHAASEPLFQYFCYK